MCKSGPNKVVNAGNNNSRVSRLHLLKFHKISFMSPSAHKRWNRAREQRRVNMAEERTRANDIILTLRRIEATMHPGTLQTNLKTGKPH